MSEPDDIIEREGGAFRTSANEDPHGTRATALALSSDQRDRLAEDKSIRRVVAFGWGAVAAIPAMLAAVPLIGDGAAAVGFCVGVLAGFACFALAGRAAMRPAPTGLSITNQQGIERTFAWSQVESFRVEGDDVHVHVREAEALRFHVGSFAENPRTFAGIPLRLDSPSATDDAASGRTGGRAPRETAARAAPVFVGGPDVELARGSRIAISVAAASVGAILAAFGTWVGVAIGHDAIGWIVGLALLYLAMTAWTLARSRVIARSSGLWVNGKLIPWPSIEDAQAGNAQGKELSSQVRVRIADADELTVSVGADAERAVEEIRRRRDLARDEVARQEHPERARSTPR